MEGGRKQVGTTHIRLRWGDLDAYGHLNNTLFFRFFEQSRVEWLEQLDMPVRLGAEKTPVIINAQCTFKMPVNYPATVAIHLFAGQPGRSSLMTWYELYVEGDSRLYAEGAAKIVWMDMKTGKSVPLPEKIRALFDDSFCAPAI